MPPNPAQLAMNQSFTTSDDKTVSFILFSLGGELYGAPLLTTREVIKRGDVKPAPYMVAHFVGVINLRGQIIGVIDLRKKFDIQPKPEAQNLILIVESPNGLLGAVVDDLTSVEKLQKEDIDQEVSLQTKVPLEFFLGVAKIKNRLVNMIDIAGCLSNDEYRILENATTTEGKSA